MSSVYGSKIVRPEELKIPRRHTLGIFPANRIKFEDLVTTLTLDPSKYYPPRVNESLRVVYNSVFAKAALEAGLKHVVVEGPWDEQIDSSRYREPRTLIHNYLFFEEPVPFKPFLWLFSEYVGECREALLRNPLAGDIVKGFRAEMPVHFPEAHNCIKYSLKADEFIEEARRALEAPTMAFYSRLEQELAQIRSINGIIPDRPKYSISPP